MSTFVSVGNANQPFSRLLEAVAILAEQGGLPLPVIVQHGHTPFVSTSCKAIDFMAMEDFSEYVQSAELLIIHAGAGSMIHACQAGKVPVVMPRRDCLMAYDISAVAGLSCSSVCLAHWSISTAPSTVFLLASLDYCQF